VQDRERDKMPTKKEKGAPFDPNVTTPKDDMKITPEDDTAYRKYEKKRLLEQDNPTIIDKETWVRINRR
jgi:hypothetical protein